MIATTKGQNCKLDLIVFGEKSAERDHLPARCIKVELPAGQKLLQRLVRSTTSHCLFIPWGQDQLSTDIGYGYANSYHYMLSADVQRALAPYDLVLRTDFDVFLTPTLLETCPEKFTTGMGNYLGEGTEEKLVKVAQKLGYTHHGVQNIGSTWYGPPADIAKVAELSMSIMKHLLYNEFEQRPDGKGPLHMLDGVGWAEWYAGVSSMYSGEIAVQHVLGKDGFVKTNHMDTHSSSSEPMLDAWTIHCWHTEQLFSKFKLFDGAYQDFNLSTVDIGTMVGYSAHVALTPVLSSGLVEQVVESHEKQQHMQKSKQL